MKTKLILKYWYVPFVLVVLIYGVYCLYKFIKKRSDKEKTKDEKVEQVLNPLNIPALKKIKLNIISQQVANNLGTSFNFLNPRRWTENDEKVYDILRYITRSEFIAVSKLYNEVHTTGRDLKTDLSQLLDDEYYNLLTHLF